MAFASPSSTPFHRRKATFFLANVSFAACILMGTSSHALAQKYTPDHPTVVEMVDAGVAFLSASNFSRSEQGSGLLSAYTIYKVNSDPNHPAVVAGIRDARRLASIARSGRTVGIDSLYAISLAAMLLASVDVQQNGDDIRVIRDFLIYHQRKEGGFGYLQEGGLGTSGDISQTQYVMLALWTMAQLEIDVSNDTVVAALNFLMSAQTMEGGWPYQFGGAAATANINPPNTNSLTAAGMSALLISGDLLGLYRSKFSENQEEEGIVPTAFRRVVSGAEKNKVNIDRTRLETVTKKGENWTNNHPYSRAQWHYYYIYSRERYESFLEITKGSQKKSPDWYNQGVELLQAAQAKDGSWGGANDADSPLAPEICTSFAVLFLIRSTQKTIGTLNEAYVVGGIGLPDDVSAISAAGGKVMSRTATTSIDDALKMLETEGKSDSEDALMAEKIILSTDPTQRKAQLNRFARLLSAKEARTRKVAAKLLGRGDDLDQVPALIYALTDPDDQVPHIAEQSLRLISRQLETYHLPKDKSQKLSDQSKVKASVQWKRWYRSLRPDHVFVD